MNPTHENMFYYPSDIFLQALPYEARYFLQFLSFNNEQARMQLEQMKTQIQSFRDQIEQLREQLHPRHQGSSQQVLQQYSKTPKTFKKHLSCPHHQCQKKYSSRIALRAHIRNKHLKGRKGKTIHM